MATWIIELLKDVALDSSGNGEIVATLTREGVLIDSNWQYTGKLTDAIDAAKAKMAEYEQQQKELTKFKAGRKFTVVVD